MTSFPRRRPDGPPLIGVTGRRLPGRVVEGLEERYQRHEVDLGFASFPAAISADGGLPVQLSFEADPEAVVARIDGLVVTGGQDVDPLAWGGDPACAAGPIDVRRDAYEMALIGAATRRGIPVLGVCRGMQLINVVQGGTLVGDLPTSPIDHRSPALATDARAHAVTLRAGSVAHRLYGDRYDVNSLHHQAVARLGRGLRVSAEALDGTVEAIEMDHLPVLGVQWHPEWLDGRDPAFRWLVNAATDVAYGCYEPRLVKE